MTEDLHYVESTELLTSKAKLRSVQDGTNTTSTTVDDWNVDEKRVIAATAEVLV